MFCLHISFLESVLNELLGYSRVLRPQTHKTCGSDVGDDSSGFVTGPGRILELCHLLNAGGLKREVLCISIAKEKHVGLPSTQEAVASSLPAPVAEHHDHHSVVSQKGVALLDAVFAELYGILASCDGVLPGTLRWMFTNLMLDLCCITQELPGCLRQSFRGDLSRYHSPTLPFLLPLTSEIQAAEFLWTNQKNMLLWLGVHSDAAQRSSSGDPPSTNCVEKQAVNRVCPSHSDLSVLGGMRILRWYRDLQCHAAVPAAQCLSTSENPSAVPSAESLSPTVSAASASLREKGATEGFKDRSLRARHFWLSPAELIQRQVLGVITASAVVNRSPFLSKVLTEHQQALDAWMASALIVIPETAEYAATAPGSVAVETTTSPGSSKVAGLNSSLADKPLEPKKKKMWGSALWSSVMSPSTTTPLDTSIAESTSQRLVGSDHKETAVGLVYRILDISSAPVGREILTCLSFSLQQQPLEKAEYKIDTHGFFDRLAFRSTLSKPLPSLDTKRAVTQRKRKPLTFECYHPSSHALNTQVFSSLRWWMKAVDRFRSDQRRSVAPSEPSFSAAVTVYAVRILEQYLSCFGGRGRHAASPSCHALLHMPPVLPTFLGHGHLINCPTLHGNPASQHRNSDTVNAASHYIGKNMNTGTFVSPKKEGNCTCCPLERQPGLAVFGFPHAAA